MPGGGPVEGAPDRCHGAGHFGDGGANPGRDRRGGAGRAPARAPPCTRGDRVDCPGGPQPGVRREPRARRRAGTGNGRRARSGRARWADAYGGPRPRRHRTKVRRPRAPHRLPGTDRQADHGLRPARGGEGHDRGAARCGWRNRVRGLRRSRRGLRRRRAADCLQSRRRDGGANLRFHRRLRRLPRRLPDEHPR